MSCCTGENIRLEVVSSQFKIYLCHLEQNTFPLASVKCWQLNYLLRFFLDKNMILLGNLKSLIEFTTNTITQCVNFTSLVVKEIIFNGMISHY